MTAQVLITGVLAGAGIILLGAAVWNERHMQRHRQPGVTYRAVTLRGDDGWRRADLFTPAGLQYQRRASGFGAGDVELSPNERMALDALAARVRGNRYDRGGMAGING
jgi:hypothetical protein